MSYDAVTTFIIDLKRTPEGRVQILEFGRAWNFSSFEGHDKNSDKKALADKIGPFYSTLGMPVVQLGKDGVKFPKVSPHFINAEMVQCNDDLDLKLSKMKDKDLLVLSKNFSQTDRFALGDIGRFCKSMLIVDKNPLLWGCMHNKALLAFYLASRAPEIFPKTELIKVNGYEPEWGDFAFNDPAYKDGVVLKAPNSSNGRDVVLFQPNADDFERSFDSAARQIQSLGDFDLMVVQPLVHGAKIKHPDPSYRGVYDTTIRVVATAVHQNGQTSLHFHDVGYHKFPKKPAGTTRYFWPEAYKSDTEHGSKLLDDIEMAAIEGQLQKNLAPAIADLIRENAADIARGLVASDSRVDHELAHMIAGDSHTLGENMNVAYEILKPLI